MDEELGLPGGDSYKPVNISDQDIDSLLGKLEEAHRGVASSEIALKTPPPDVQPDVTAPVPEPVAPVAKPAASVLISAPYPTADQSISKEKKKKKKKEAADIKDPIWDANAFANTSKSKPPQQQQAASRNSLTDFRGESASAGALDYTPSNESSECSMLSGTVLPSTGNSQLMTNLLVMLGVCGIEMIVATAACSLVAWMDMYCRLAAVLNMLYDMEVLDSEQESAIVDGHSVSRSHVGEITILRDPAERASKAAEMAKVKQLQDKRAAYLSILLVATYVITISFVTSVSALTKLYTSEEPNENSGWLMIVAILCVVVDQVHKYYGFDLCFNDIDASTVTTVLICERYVMLAGVYRCTTMDSLWSIRTHLSFYLPRQSGSYSLACPRSQIQSSLSQLLC